MLSLEGSPKAGTPGDPPVFVLVVIYLLLVNKVRLSLPNLKEEAIQRRKPEEFLSHTQREIGSSFLGS
jgi:hypothetical protein